MIPNELWSSDTNFVEVGVEDGEIAGLIRKHFPLRPSDIIEHLKLKRPIYKKTAAYGHFGRNDPDFTWERTDKAEALRAAAGTLQTASA